ncbi:MAG: class I SAM-dependent methyltransferase [Phycisphaerales bacterium JB063]
MQIVETTACNASFETHDQDRALFQGEFCRRLAAEPKFAGEKLDIGCGGGFPRAFDSIRDLMGVVDGVDPFPEVNDHAGLRNRWHGTFEQADIPTDGYDLAYAYNVVEHIEHAAPFFETLRRVLKPGGVFWALTPHGKHPFCKCVKLVQKLRLKNTAGKHADDYNEYPSYYRLNRVEDIAAAAERAGFEKLETVYIPSVQWDHYFPRPMRFVPHLYDKVRGLKKPNAMLILAYRLE